MTAIFITATDTGVGKTFFSAQIINTLISQGSYKKEEIAYYKPVQCGEEKLADKYVTDFSYIQSKTGVDVYNSYFLKAPASPHYAAQLENKEIKLEKILEDFNNLKEKYKFIIVEGAGGIAVPINECDLVSDMIAALSLPVIIVTRPDLGTINHSQLTIGHSYKKKLHILGLLVTEPNQSLENYSISDTEFLEKQRKNSLETICKNMDVRILDVASLATVAGEVILH